MADLERLLGSVGPAIDWPETPPVALHFEPRPRRPGAPLVVAFAALAAAVAAALAVPGARSAILHFLHLGGVTIERVQSTPRAPERPLAQDLGPLVPRRTAETALGGPFRLPAGTARSRLYLSGTVVSTVLESPDEILLTELRAGIGSYILKKVAGTTTHVVWTDAHGHPALWISGNRHEVFLPPSAPPRLAGNVLIWLAGDVTYRLESPTLTRSLALRIAGEIDGT